MSTKLTKVFILAFIIIGHCSFITADSTFKSISKIEAENQRALQLDCIILFPIATAKSPPKKAVESENKPSCLTAYSEFSPNGDGRDDIFFITCIEEYPNNYLQVFNRFGTKVFDMKGYNNTWDGGSTGITTRGAKRKLPVGTYYFLLDPGDGATKQKKGWIYLSE